MSSRQDLYPSRQQAEPQWLERQDPVVYSQDPAAAPIAPELIAQYKRDGYMVIPELFSPAEVAVMTAELERLRHDRLYWRLTRPFANPIVVGYVRCLRSIMTMRCLASWRVTPALPK